jgi:hypothetical protein
VVVGPVDDALDLAHLDARERAARQDAHLRAQREPALEGRRDGGAGALG